MLHMMLGAVLAKWRWAQVLTVREAAKMIGLSSATYMRIEQGKPMDGRTLATILRWLTSDGKAKP